MDPYKILCINNNATQIEIRKAYRVSVLKYHPDKCKETDAETKIKEIYAAYQILNNDVNKLAYDSMIPEGQTIYYNEFKTFFNMKFPKFSDLMKNIIDITYDSEEEFKNDFNKFDYPTICTKIINKIPQLLDKFDPPTPEIFTNVSLDINSQINISFTDRYMNRYTKINVNRFTKDPINLLIPNKHNLVTFNNQGETSNNIHGDINIIVNVLADDYFTQVDHDIYCKKEITMYEYFYGGNFDITLPNNITINIPFESMINNIPLIRLVNKGMPYNESDKGSLYINLEIKDVNLTYIKNKIINIY
jgi:DnaJ-class molecular chaperone